MFRDYWVISDYFVVFALGWKCLSTAPEKFSEKRKINLKKNHNFASIWCTKMILVSMESWWKEHESSYNCVFWRLRMFCGRRHVCNAKRKYGVRAFPAHGTFPAYNFRVKVYTAVFSIESSFDRYKTRWCSSIFSVVFSRKTASVGF